MARLRCLSRVFGCRRAARTLCLLSLFLLPASVLATPTDNYYEEAGDVFDDWDICRTRVDGRDGFFQYVSGQFEPAIVTQSLGENTDRAYVRGVQFGMEYADETRRAEAIFAYVRDKVRYTSDSSQFGHLEFAQNADELLAVIDDEGVGYGDCEDYAILLGAMYVGAGIRSAIVLAPDHAATLVYLPGYAAANRVLTLNGDSGWVWAEATGGNNPLGWMPQQYMGARLLAYELEDVGTRPLNPPDKVTTSVRRRTGGDLTLPLSPYWLVLLLLWLMSSLGRRRDSSR